MLATFAGMTWHPSGEVANNDEREDRIKEILDRNKVHDLFPNILPLKKSQSPANKPGSAD